MKFPTLVVILIPFFTLSILSCNKDNDPNMMQEKDEQTIMQSYDCTFEQNDENMDGLIDDNERAIMNECRENAFTSKVEIENNLIGEWELIGHGEGWVPRISQPCGYLTISMDELVFEFTNAWIDTITTHSWTIKETESVNDSKIFNLETTPKTTFILPINEFCPEYMFGNITTIIDGNLYLYKKVN